MMSSVHTTTTDDTTTTTIGTTTTTNNNNHHQECGTTSTTTTVTTSTSSSSPPSTSSNTTIQIHNVTLPLLTNDRMTWYQSSFITVQQMTSSGLQLLLQTSYIMQQLVQNKNKKKKTKTNDDDDDTMSNILDSLSNHVIGTIFYEASTRTSCSFQTATLRLHGTYIHIDGMGNTSTNKKGETLYDTIKCIQCYTDAIVLRHPITGSIYTILQQHQQQQQQLVQQQLEPGSSSLPPSVRFTKPIVNAGDGTGEHPTQALLDIYTMYTEYIIHRCQYHIPSTFIIVLLGDLKHGRTVHSLVQLFISNCTCNILYTQQLIIRCCAPNDTLQLPSDIIANDSNNNNNNNNNNIQMEYYTDPLLACQNANVLYVTRIQRERFQNDDDYNSVKGSYVVNMEFLNKVTALSSATIPNSSNSNSSSSHDMIVLHPLPRVDEISTDMDHDPRAVYFQQMEYGMYVRMAILYLILDHQQHADNDEVDDNQLIK